MSSYFGNKIRVQVFGQSHSDMLGVVIDGLPAGIQIDLERIVQFLERRKGGKGSYTTKRAESDMPRIVSGLVEGKTCGAPLCAVFENNNIRSGDYAQFRTIPRPSHADYNAHIKYGGANDIRGGGHFSARMTLPLCFAGAICVQILENKGIYIGAHIAKIAGMQDIAYDPVAVCKDDFVREGFPVNDQNIGAKMIEAISQAANEGDSLGGVIECAVVGLPLGIGEPMFDGLENKLSQVIFAIPAVKGIEFGAGFEAADMLGSQHNDSYVFESGEVKTLTNHAGGIVGGISTGMPLLFKVAVKPTPSIAKPQHSVNLQTGENTLLEIKGRHDPCVAPRAVPCVEAVVAIALADMILI